MNNTQFIVPAYHGVTKCLVALGISIMITLAKWIFDIPSDAGFALLFVGIFLSLTCIAVLPMFARRKRMYNSLTSGKGAVVGWQIDDVLFVEAARKKREDQKQKNKALLIVVGILFFVISLIFTIITWDEAGVAIFLICMGIYGVIALFASIVPTVSYAKALRQGRYAFVGEDCALIGKELHVFVGGKMFGSATRLSHASYVPAEQQIAIRYSVLTRMGFTPYTAQIPVPAAAAEQARYIVNAINSKHAK